MGQKKGQPRKASSGSQIQDMALFGKGDERVFDESPDLPLVPGPGEIDPFAVPEKKPKVVLKLIVHASSFREK